MSFWSATLGLFITLALGACVPRIVGAVETNVRAKHPDPDSLLREPGGELTGYLECAIFFGSFAMDGVGLLAAWLAFKTAAKWKTWDTTEKISSAEIPVRCRIFVIGTGVNIVAALAG